MISYYNIINCSKKNFIRVEMDHAKLSDLYFGNLIAKMDQAELAVCKMFVKIVCNSSIYYF